MPSSQLEHIQVMIADDAKMFRIPLVTVLKDMGLNITGQAENGKELLSLVRQNPPHVVLLDIRMPVMDGEETLTALRKEFPSVKTIVLSMEHSEYYIAEMLLKGASSYIVKGDSVEELVLAIQEVYTNGFYFNRNVSAHILDLLKSEGRSAYVIDDVKFSSRELDVLRELCKGKKTELIAAELNISTNTVNFHKKNLMEKTNSHGIIALVKYAIRQGIDKNYDLQKKKRTY